MPQTPIFLISLPRSGSTLLQRLLSQSPEICTVPEPWLLLPLFYSAKPSGTLSVYGHQTCATAIRDLIDRLPGGLDEAREFIRDACTSFYGRLGEPSAKYFLDKTPRYHLIIDDILETFPDARVLLLFRHPLAVVASMIHSYANRWNLYGWEIDLYAGLEKMVACTLKNDHRVLGINYETLVSSPANVLRTIEDHLSISLDRCSQLSSHAQLQAGMGDHTGARDYSTLADEPLDKWRNTLNTVVRKRWARSYISWIGAERLRVMGYDARAIQEDLASLRTKSVGVRDLWWQVHGSLNRMFEINVMRGKMRAWRNGKRNYMHQ